MPWRHRKLKFSKKKCQHPWERQLFRQTHVNNLLNAVTSQDEQSGAATCLHWTWRSGNESVGALERLEPILGQNLNHLQDRSVHKISNKCLPSDLCGRQRAWVSTAAVCSKKCFALTKYFSPVGTFLMNWNTICRSAVYIYAVLYQPERHARICSSLTYCHSHPSRCYPHC